MSILTVALEENEEGEAVYFGAVYNPADARRIVACVNALEGIPTDELEKAGTGMMSEAAVCVGKLTKQREELVALLKDHLGDNPKGEFGFCECGLCKKSRACIAEIEAEA